MPKSPGIPKLAEKLAEAIRMRGVTQADVARAFGVKPPTVSQDWLRHGRIGKHHFPRLVEYFELPYEWWFGQPTSHLFAIRRANLKVLLAEAHGGKRGEAAKAWGVTVANLAAYERGDAPIEGDLARRVEAAANKPQGWLDVPPHREGSSARRTIDERWAALPEPLRAYLLGELELCETVAMRIPSEFLMGPSAGNVRAFQDYLRSLLEKQGPQRKAG